jgi:hypothetical protein
MCAAIAAAQSSVDAYFGGGYATGKSSGATVDTFGDGTLYSTPRLNNPFLTLGGSVMLKPHLGVGAQFSFQPGKSDYAGLQTRPLFYDFNAIYRPVNTSGRVVPEFQAGMGGVNVRFYYSESACSVFTGCSSSSSFVESANHFQLHLGGGVRFYATQHVFVRPQFDLRWVNDFQQYGSNWVPQYSVAVGYQFGER